MMSLIVPLEVYLDYLEEKLEINMGFFTVSIVYIHFEQIMHLKDMNDYAKTMIIAM